MKTGYPKMKMAPPKMKMGYLKMKMAPPKMKMGYLKMKMTPLKMKMRGVFAVVHRPRQKLYQRWREEPSYANKKDIRPEKPDFIGLFHVSGACPRAYKNVDVKRLFYRFSGK